MPIINKKTRCIENRLNTDLMDTSLFFGKLLFSFEASFLMKFNRLSFSNTMSVMPLIGDSTKLIFIIYL